MFRTHQSRIRGAGSTRFGRTSDCCSGASCSVRGRMSRTSKEAPSTTLIKCAYFPARLHYHAPAPCLFPPIYTVPPHKLQAGREQATDIQTDCYCGCIAIRGASKVQHREGKGDPCRARARGQRQHGIIVSASPIRNTSCPVFFALSPLPSCPPPFLFVVKARLRLLGWQPNSSLCSQ